MAEQMGYLNELLKRGRYTHYMIRRTAYRAERAGVLVPSDARIDIQEL